MIKGLTAAFVIAATIAVMNAQEPIAIGVVREDGHLMPITLITPQLFADPPLTTDTLVNGEPLETPKRGNPEWPFKGLAWTLVFGRGRTPVDIKTVEPLMVRMPYCSDRLMWRTTLRGPPVDENQPPVRKLGMAVSGATWEFPEDVRSQPDPASRRVARRVVALFLTKEKARLAVEEGQYGVSSAPGSPPVVIQELQRHAIGGVTTYYFEAIKALKLSDGSVFPDAGLVTGWIADSASGLTDYEVIYKINDDAYKQNERAIVRGIVPYRGKALWLLEWHGWENEYYTLHDWPSGIRRAIVNAYEC